MFRLTCLLVLIFTSQYCSATTEYYWVLGSYQNETNARKEQTRLAASLDSRVAVRYFENLKVYRVLVNSAKVTDDAVEPLNAWLVPLVVPVEDEEMVTSLEPPNTFYVEPIEDPLIIMEPPPEPLYPEINSGESLEQYCARLPESPLCLHPRIHKMIQRERALSIHRAALEDACDIITNPRLHQTCIAL